MDFKKRCKPCHRSRHHRVCGGCMRILLSGKGTCVTFSAPRRLSIGHTRVTGFRCSTSAHIKVHGSLALPGRRIRTLVTSKGRCIMHFGVRPGRSVRIGSLVHNRIIVGSSVLSSGILCGSTSRLPACRLTGVMSSRLVRISRIVHNRR